MIFLCPFLHFLVVPLAVPFPPDDINRCQEAGRLVQDGKLRLRQVDDVAAAVHAEVDLSDQIPAVGADRAEWADKKLGFIDFQNFMLVVTDRYVFPFFFFQDFMQQLFSVAAVAIFPVFVAAFAAAIIQVCAGADQGISDSGTKFFCSPADSISVDRSPFRYSLTISAGASL